VYLEDDVATLAWWQTALMEQEPWLTPHSGLPVKRLTDYAPARVDDLAAAVGQCVERASTAGLDVIVVDQTQPDLDLYAVKVIAPGMRHFWRRLGAGRLYTVPVELGWLPTATPESDLNPKNVFF
jgi:ribosomal protein S12 methylthiotransferase accessory factor